MIGGESILVNTSSLRHYFQGAVDGNFADWVTHHELLHHIGEIAAIIFFLMGAMTIVEMVDSYEGFRIITDKITTTRRVKLLWVTSILTFFMSAVLDNLTTSIVMVALLRKLISDQHDRWFYAGMVIVAANAGGAWSPIGDVTTIMLWIANKVSTLSIIQMTFIPSLVSMLVPLAILSFTMKGNVTRPSRSELEANHMVNVSKAHSNLVFFIGVGGLLFVPVFKSLTHLPPYLGMLFSLGVIWTVTEILHKQRDAEQRASSRSLTIVGVLRKVDVPSVLFFLGILMAVAALSTTGHLELLASTLQEHVGNLYVINIIIGLLSAIVDNVPLVAGAMGMYNFAMDHYFWEFLAYCAGTGGSILIIGSAAGVAVMGMEHIDFIWYLRRISLLALIGYLAGAGVYIIQEESGILEFGAEESKNILLDLGDREQVSTYLLTNEFITPEDGEEAYKMHFIRYHSEQTGETMVGYHMGSETHGKETWGGIMEHKAPEYSMDEGRLKIIYADKEFFLTPDGRLLEILDTAGNVEPAIRTWSRLVEGEEE
jgi:Na+/H+ antiporter NhaD/arsenite permease-like protein